MDVDKVVDEVTDMVVAIKVEKVVGMVFLFLYSDYFYDWKFQHSPSGFTIYKMQQAYRVSGVSECVLIF